MNSSLTCLVEQTVQSQMQARTSFTALDISNTLKGQRYPVRHGDVACAVREIFQSGAMGFYDYSRQLIEVATSNGPAQAFLYRHGASREREYTQRAQSSLPPVPSEQARPLEDVNTASLLPRPIPNRGCMGRRARVRRDGAVSVPGTIISTLGWQTGDALMLDITDDAIELIRTTCAADSHLTVWQEGRVRVCRRTLARAALTAGSVMLTTGTGTLRLTGLQL